MAVDPLARAVAPTVHPVAQPADAAAFAKTVLQVVDASVPKGEAVAPLPTGIGRFQTITLLGEGGMGRVVVAEDRQFGRTVAMKELLPGLGSKGLLDRFAVESVVTGNLEHPGVPAVYERGVREDGAPFYTMRLVRGDTLLQRLSSARTMRDRLALLPAIVRLAHTLAFAHEHGVVHRDVKPENVVLGRHGETVLLDWGIAKVRGEIGDRVDAVDAALEATTAPKSATSAGTLLGTPAYMAPEQAAARVADVDERTDVFAVGAVLYHVLAGRPPYDGADTMAIVGQAIRAEPTPLGSDVPPALSAIVARAMARDRTARYQSATELAEALEAFTTEAVATKDPKALRVFADVASWIGFVLMALLSIAAFRMVAPALRESPVFIMISILLTTFGCALSFFEARTSGRLALSRLSLAFTVTTQLMGVLGACLGLVHVLRAVSPAAMTAAERTQIVVDGVPEALSGLAFATTLTALQIVVWAMARRRVELVPQVSAPAGARS